MKNYSTLLVSGILLQSHEWSFNTPKVYTKRFELNIYIHFLCFDPLHKNQNIVHSVSFIAEAISRRIGIGFLFVYYQAYPVHFNNYVVKVTLRKSGVRERRNILFMLLRRATFVDDFILNVYSCYRQNIRECFSDYLC